MDQLTHLFDAMGLAESGWQKCPTSSQFNSNTPMYIMIMYGPYTGTISCHAAGIAQALSLHYPGATVIAVRSRRTKKSKEKTNGPE